MLFAFLPLALTMTLLVTVQGLHSYTRHPQTRLPAQSAKEEILTNDSIIQLLKAGLEEDLIISKIQKTKHNFDTSTEGLIALKLGGASSRLIQFMMDPSKPLAPSTTAENGKPQASSQAVSNRASDSALPTPAGAGGSKSAVSKDPTTLMPSPDELALASDPKTEEVGFYLIEGGTPMQLQVTGFSKQKVSLFSMIGTATTMGVYKTKQKAVVRGPRASVRSKSQKATFLLRAPEGGSPGDYVVIRLEKKGNSREILVGSFSILGGASGGFEEKRVMKFSSSKLASGKYLIRFDSDLEPGEYAFYPTTGLQSSGAGVSTTGRMYDFGIDK
ncbi:MAG: hypothetical protein ABJB61_14520 [bacterium]